MFNIGDILTAKEGNPYSVTNCDSILSVVNVKDNSRICVEVIEHTDPYLQIYIGGKHWVDAKFFKIYSNSIYDCPWL